MLYKDLMTPETYNYLNAYIQVGFDGISMLADDYKGVVPNNSTNVVSMFQATADPEYFGKVKADFPGKPVMLDVPRYSKEGYSSFAIRDKALRLRFPFVSSLSSGTRLFADSEKVCPDFKEIAFNLQQGLKIKIKDDSRIDTPIHRGILSSTLRLSGDHKGYKIAEAEKLALIFYSLANKGIDKKQFANTTNEERMHFASKLLATIFMCQSYDMGKNFNYKIENALKLQLSNTIAALGNVQGATLSKIGVAAEKYMEKFLQKTGKTYKDIIDVREIMGITYKTPPTNLHEALFGATTNNRFKELGIDEEIVEEIMEIKLLEAPKPKFETKKKVEFEYTYDKVKAKYDKLIIEQLEQEGEKLTNKHEGYNSDKKRDKSSHLYDKLHDAVAFFMVEDMEKSLKAFERIENAKSVYDNLVVKLIKRRDEVLEELFKGEQKCKSKCATMLALINSVNKNGPYEKIVIDRIIRGYAKEEMKTKKSASVGQQSEKV